MAKKKTKTIQVITKFDQVRKWFNLYYSHPNAQDSKWAIVGGKLDDHRFCQLVNIRTGIGFSTISRYRRKLEEFKR